MEIESMTKNDTAVLMHLALKHKEARDEIEKYTINFSDAKMIDKLVAGGQVQEDFYLFYLTKAREAEKI